MVLKILLFSIQPAYFCDKFVILFFCIKIPADSSFSAPGLFSVSNDTMRCQANEVTDIHPICPLYVLKPDLQIADL